MNHTLKLIKAFTIVLLCATYPNAHAQDPFSKLEKLLVDTAYVDAYKETKSLLKLYPLSSSLQTLRLNLKIPLNEWDGMCSLIEIGRTHAATINPYLKYYEDLACVQNKQDMKKGFLKMYKQKGQTKENGFVTTYTKADSLRGTLNAWRSCYDVSHYDLQLRINTKKHFISGSNVMSFQMLESADKIQIDAKRDLIIDSIVFENTQLDFKREHDAFFVSFPKRLEQKKSYKLKIYYHGKPADATDPPWEGGFVWKKNKSSKVWASVACEHLGASFWWPCKDHPSDEPDSMRMSFDVPRPFKAISNGTFVGEYKLKDEYNRHVWKLNNPINTYNVTFYIGNFVRFTEAYVSPTGRHDSLEFFAMPHNVQQAKQYFKLSNEVMFFYEKAFGEYPFWSDGYCLVESPYAGMEHQSAIAIGPDYGKIKKDEARYLEAKDDYLIIHETAHEWWGNSVTAIDMSDAWLQEGFATYSELMFLENKYGQELFLKEINFKRYQILNLWPLLGNKNVNDNSFIGGDIYNKGAMLLQNIRANVDNDSLFFAIIKSYALKYRHKMVETNDFLRHVNELSQKDHTKMFDAYLKQTTIPTLLYTYDNDDAGNIQLTYKWINVAEGFELPFSIHLSDGRFVKLFARTKEETTSFAGIKHFNFLSNQINLRNCPANHYSYFNTFMKQ